jgi:uncharacterized membrane protein YfcA
MPARSPSLPVLAGIGTVAGFFAALFGVGGGILIVPLLMAFAGFEARRATATSLAAILFTGVYGAVRYQWSGQVRWGEAVAIGIPALAGVLVGTTLQSRISSDTLTFLFAALMAVVGLRLLIGG